MTPSDEKNRIPEKITRKYFLHILKQSKKSVQELTQVSYDTGFDAGIAYVRTSPEWLAMEMVVRDARVGVFHHTPCPTHFAVGVCVLEELLAKALKELDRVRGGK